MIYLLAKINIEFNDDCPANFSANCFSFYIFYINKKPHEYTFRYILYMYNSYDKFIGENKYRVQ